MSFQENLIRARKARGMTQEELAARLSISRQAVSKWETGESLPDLYKLAALADELGVSTDELCGREPAALCGEVPATAFAGDAAEREAFAEELRRIAKQNRSLRYVVGILVLICGVLTMLSGYRSLQNSKAPSNEITTPAPLPDTITISGLTLDIDGIALVFRFVPSVSGEGYEWSASCAPDNNGLISVETTTDGGICTVRLLNVPRYGGVTLSATVTNGAESRSICLATDIRVGENSIIAEGASVINSVKIQDCFVGEACQLSNGFTASTSVFFANSYMSNGEACAAFCGPFTASHHKSSLLIGGMFSFYNAGSATNFSNHAYKMGPMHWGILERGSKTASGAYLLMPATLGSFSVCFGKLMHHPNTRNLPFAYLIADGDKMFLIPGRNITTVGLYRDIKKWPKRDMRALENRKSIVNFDWLSPYSVGEVLKGKKILENLRDVTGDNVSQYLYHEYIIPASSLHKGIKYYDIALRIYMGAVLKRVLKRDPMLTPPTTQIGLGDWDDLSGLLLPNTEEERIITDLQEGTINTIQQLLERFEEINANYREYQWAWTYQMVCDYYDIDEITLEDANRIHEDYIKARRQWIAEIRKDAEKEFAMGDVEEEVFRNFVDSLDQEVEYED
mgnify:CR=1 FL=1